MVQCSEQKSSDNQINEKNGTPQDDVKITRKTVDCSDLSKNLFSNTDNNLRQFACIYSARLEELSKILKKCAKEKWQDVKIVPLADLENFKGDRCVVIGTVFKHQQWKPSILRELCEEDQLILSEPRADYCSESDQLFFEDDTSRIKLVGDNLEMGEIVTGVVSAVLGHENENSTFQVEDWCFPSCIPQNKNRSQTSGKLVLLSGLNMSNDSNKLSTILLTEWLCGLSGNPTVQEADASIVHIIIAGNSIKSSSGLRTNNDLTNFTAGYSNYSEIVDGLEKLDIFISEIAENCCVTLMPGQEDVCSLMMPQKQMHPSLLPKSRKYETFMRVTNPWVSKVGTRIIAGSSGQPIDDIMKACGKMKSPLTWLEKCLIWRHFCPTCPDTLPAYPCSQNVDTMVMKECPDIFFAGNMDKFETKLWKGNKNETVRLICVPNFSTTETTIIVDLETLDVQAISFGAN